MYINHHNSFPWNTCK